MTKTIVSTEVIALLAHAYRTKYFPEEFDHAYDSAWDRAERKQGQSPMTADYLSRVNARREALGATPLGENGLPIDDSSGRIAKNWAQGRAYLTEMTLSEVVYEALLEGNPLALDCEDETVRLRYQETVPLILERLALGGSFERNLGPALAKVFGGRALKGMSVRCAVAAYRQRLIETSGL